MMMYVTSELWKPTDVFVLENNAEIVVKSKKNILVTAGPGAGKTEMLAQRANYLFVTNCCLNPFKILAISFKKDAAENLKNRVMSRCGEIAQDRFVSLTYDAFAKKILDQYIAALPSEIRPNPNYLIHDEKNNYTWSIIQTLYLHNNLGQQQSESEIDFKDRIREDIYSFKFSQLNRMDSAKRAILLSMLKGFGNIKPVLTYDMIKKLALCILYSSPAVLNVIRETYLYVFLDEFQDTTWVQYGLIKKCFKDTNIIMTAVGDEKQKIMTWAGALPNAFELFQSDFKAERKQLVLNHRSAPKLVALQKAMYDLLDSSMENVVYVNKWKGMDGRIVFAEIENENYEKVYIVEEIKKYKALKFESKDICIICRNHPERLSYAIIQELENNGIYARLEADYIDLMKSPIVKIILSFIRLILGSNLFNDWNDIVDLCIKSRNIDIKNEDAYFNLIKELHAFIDKLQYDKNFVNEYNKMSALIDEILGFISINGIKQLFAEYAGGSTLDDHVKKFKDKFWNSYAKMHYSWENGIEYFEGEKSIPIMTIHKSKGLEYKLVIFLGLEDQVFWNFSSFPKEERCSFFVALSRAQTDLIFTYCKYRNHRTRTHLQVNEFHELLTNSGLAEIVYIP